jgi:hypothetical protein
MTIKLVECERDGFPILDINGQEQCLAEFVDYCIGGKKITDVVVRNDTLYYVFENRHELPLLCYCCGEPLTCPDLRVEKKNLRGRTLQAMSWNTEQLEDGRNVIDFQLEFSRKDGEENVMMVATSTLSANKMRHTVLCSHSGLPASMFEAPRISIAPPPSKKRHKRK